jgi:hypothetical protein
MVRSLGMISNVVRLLGDCFKGIFLILLGLAVMFPSISKLISKNYIIIIGLYLIFLGLKQIILGRKKSAIAKAAENNNVK